jgi:hypothetical protein
MLKRFAHLLLLALLLIIPIHAQDSVDEEIPQTPPLPLIQYGAVISGRIDDEQPRLVYELEGLRCDFVSVEIRTTSGDLDPVLLMIADDNQTIVARDDSVGSQNIVFEPLAIPRTGRFELIVGRFGYELGLTAGTFEMVIERIGNGSAPNCAMRYGDTVFYAISDDEPEVIYSFRGRQGDIISVSMQRRSGNLDSYLKIVDAFGVVLDSNDDRLGDDTKDASIDTFIVPEDGVYFIFATRYGQRAGDSTGNFSLMLREATYSGTGNTAQSALNINYGLTVEGDLSDLQSLRYYRFQAQQNDLISVNLSRASGTLNSTVTITNASLQELVNNADNTPITDWLVPADGTYYLVVSRQGTSAGNYRLSLESAGNAFAEVPSHVRRVRYGTSITGTIDDITPSIRYAFFGESGDVIRLAMDSTSGDLDSVITVLNVHGRVLMSDDNSGIDRNARIDRFTLPNTGVYYIEAGRVEGETVGGSQGSFLLVLAQIFD